MAEVDSEHKGYTHYCLGSWPVLPSLRWLFPDSKLLSGGIRTVVPHMHEEYPFPAGIFQTGSQAPPMSWFPQKRWDGLYPVARTGTEKRLHCPVEAVVSSISFFRFSALSTINYRASCVFTAAPPQACSNIQSMGVRHAGSTGSPLPGLHGSSQRVSYISQFLGFISEGGRALLPAPWPSNITH